MRKLIISAAAIAAVMASSGAVSAQTVSDCGPVPNEGQGMHWMVEPFEDVDTSEPSTSYTSGGAKQIGTVNGFETVTTTTSSGFQCVLYNKNDKATDTVVELTQYTTSTTATTSTKICGAGKDADGNPLPAC